MLIAATKSYRQGWFDGVRECVAQILGDSTTVQSYGMYDGPLPDELRLWAERLRKRLDDVEAREETL